MMLRNPPSEGLDRALSQEWSLLTEPSTLCGSYVESCLVSRLVCCYYLRMRPWQL